MLLARGLALYAFTPFSSSQPYSVVEISDYINNLSFSTTDPGGYSEIAFDLALATPRLPRLELAAFSQIALMPRRAASIGTSGPGVKALFLGEIAEPALLMDQDGEKVSIKAYGLGKLLKDDPLSVSYNGLTAKQILSDQLTNYNRTNFLSLDPDQSAILPNNPGDVFSLSYSSATIEEVIANVAIYQGGASNAPYSWGVWSHPTNTNAFGLPTARLEMQLADYTTPHLRAYVRTSDITGYRIVPSTDRAYNIIEIAYNDPASGGFGLATYADARLAANGAQGVAPFRRKKISRDLTGVATVTKALAQQIANSYGQQFQNISNKITLTLALARDGNDQPVDLWLLGAAAGLNIAVPDLLTRSQILALTPTPSVNLFHIVSATYDESGASPQVTLELDNYFDSVELQVARLQQQADVQQRRSGRTTGVVQALGASERGRWSKRFSNGAAGGQEGHAITFRAAFSQAPTSITFTPDANGSSNVSGPYTSALTPTGADAYVTVVATGSGYWTGSYQTNGNCLVDVDEARETFAHHCDECERRGGVALRRGLRLRPRQHPRGGDLVFESSAPSATPDASAAQNAPQDMSQRVLAVICPSCGSVECFNTAVTLDDAADTRTPGAFHAWRARQAQLIRALLTHPNLQHL